MKKMKRLICAMVVVAMMASFFTVPEQKVMAAAKATVTKAVHLEIYNSGIDIGDEDDAITIKYASPTDYIANLKTSSKNLKAKVTSESCYIDGGVNDTVFGDKITCIGLCANKVGTYTVTFDIYNDKKQKVSSHSVKVYANRSSAIKSATYAGQHMYTYTNKAKGKLSVTMNKDYKLKKVVVETYNKNGERQSKTVKNNSVITLGKYTWKSESGKGTDYYNLNTSVTASTWIYVYYVDKYTKEETCKTYSMYRIAE